MLIRRLARDSVLYGGADFASKCVMLLIYPVLAAALSPLAFGALELVVTSTTLLGLIMNCGMNNATQRFYWDAEVTSEQRPIMVSSGLFGLFFFGAVAVCIGSLVVPLILPLVIHSGLPLTWVALVASLLLMAFGQWLQFALDVLRLQFAPWRFMAVSILFRVGSSVAVVVVVAWLGFGVDGLLSVQAFAALLVLPLALYFIRDDLKFRFEWSWFSQLVCFGYPFIFMSLAYWLFGSMDRWMLAYLSSVEEVGVYSVAFRFSTMVMFASAAFGQAWSPMAIKIRTDDPAGYRQAYASVLLMLLYAMLVLGGGVALFSGELMCLFMPSEYLGSALPLSILCFGAIIQSTQHVAAIGISLEKKTFLFARIAWVGAVVNFILNLMFIPLFGATGAAYATFISHIILTGSYLYVTQNLHKLPLSWNKITLFAVMGFFLFLVSYKFSASSISLLIVIAKLLTVILCIIIGWFLLPNRSFYFEK